MEVQIPGLSFMSAELKPVYIMLGGYYFSTGIELQLSYSAV